MLNAFEVLPREVRTDGEKGGCHSQRWVRAKLWWNLPQSGRNPLFSSTRSVLVQTPVAKAWHIPVLGIVRNASSVVTWIWGTLVWKKLKRSISWVGLSEHLICNALCTVLCDSKAGHLLGVDIFPMLLNGGCVCVIFVPRRCLPMSGRIFVVVVVIF